MNTTSSPAIKTLRAQVMQVTTEPTLAHLRRNALVVVNSLDSMVNRKAVMSEDQAHPLETYIIDHMAGKDGYPPLPQRIMLATYINSCRV